MEHTNYFTSWWAEDICENVGNSLIFWGWFFNTFLILSLCLNPFSIKSFVVGLFVNKYLEGITIVCGLSYTVDNSPEWVCPKLTSSHPPEWIRPFGNGMVLSLWDSLTLKVGLLFIYKCSILTSGDGGFWDGENRCGDSCGQSHDQLLNTHEWKTWFLGIFFLSGEKKNQGFFPPEYVLEYIVIW